MSTADATIARLELEYCPPLDPALLQAILSDFDLGDKASFSHARDILEDLRASAAAEEAAADFSAPSGTQISPNPFSFENETDTTDTDLTSLSNGPSKLAADSDASPQHDANVLNALDHDTKAILLQELFPDVNSYTISHTLRKCTSDWQRALDELLNISFFADESGEGADKVGHKSVDAFAETSTPGRGRRKKRKGRSDISLDDRRAQSAYSNYTESSPAFNKWSTANDDIEFVAKHANLSTSLVRSAYYGSGTSISKTIVRLLDDLMAARTAAPSETVEINAKELGSDFPTIKATYLTALIELAHPSTASAHELAKALTARSESSGRIVPQYTPVNLSDDETTTDSASWSTSARFLDIDAASQLALHHREARQQLSAQAQAAYRRSKSQKLMGGAAAYYSSVSREHAASAVAYSSAAADALVASQSSVNELDLHGVTVNDAVRIAAHRTQQWWSRLGESKVNGRSGAEARSLGYRIVVGVGRHSEGGKAKIGPAVYSMLVGNGWKVEQGSGVLTVTGKARK